jgi:hypothetical protein
VPPLFWEDDGKDNGEVGKTGSANEIENNIVKRNSEQMIFLYIVSILKKVKN